ncbi:lasso peptide biosynthesis PqqD family chaperone [Streptomyces sp. NPDC058335]|uniref:lasso peptide biosynthesis PqqD family chaperone n=1 Tax=Streptomyces sp. NPDC058335 TaxID=3346451 RepID=UPI0036600334
MMTFALVSGVSVADTENGTVLLDERNGRYWMLNRTGAVVLRCLLDGESPQEAAQTLLRCYPDAPERAAAHVESLLDALRTAKVIVP